MPWRNFTVKLRDKIGQNLKRDVGRVTKMGDITVHLYIDENDLEERETLMTQEKEIMNGPHVLGKH